MLRRTLALLLGCPLLFALCAVEPGGEELAGIGTEPDADSEPVGLVVRLVDAEPRETEPPSATSEVPPTEALDPETVARLIARAGGLPPASGDEASFSYLPDSKPAPITGAVHVQPPLDLSTNSSAGTHTEAPVAPGAALEVLRFAPEGELLIAPQLSVTFSQPMVPLATHAMLAAAEVPVAVSPAVPGAWRWIGTRTLLFEPEQRFPMATSYSVEIPAGTRSAIGGVLAETVDWRFATPAPRLVEWLPAGNSTARQPVHVLVFDQAVEAASVLEAVRAEELGLIWNTDVALRLATPGELAADEDATRLADACEPGRWVALMPVEPLPAAASMRVVVRPGLESAEGPRRTTGAQSFRYEVHGPLTVRRGDNGGVHYPGGAFLLEFSNELDAGVPLDGLVSMEPSVGELRLSINRNSLYVRGATRSGVTYRVTVGTGIRDVWGQSLEDAQRLSFAVQPFESGFDVPAGEFSVADPFDLPVVRVATMNLDELQVELRRVHPDELLQFPDSWTHLDEDDVVLPGQRVVLETLDLEPGAEATRDRRREIAVDLSSALADDLGHVVVILRGESAGERHASMHWVQRTQLAVDAVVDGERLLSWVTQLRDGSPVEGARVTLTGPDMGQVLVTAVTDAEGLAILELPEQKENTRALSARVGADVVLLPESRWAWRSQRDTNWRRRSFRERDVFSLFDDRGLYRPGEDVRIKGWARRVRFAPDGDVSRIPDVGERSARWQLRDSRGVEIATGSAPLDVFGGFDLELALPADINLGQAVFRVALEDDDDTSSWDAWLQVLVQDYRTPEYEVTVQAGAGPHVVEGDALLTAQALYHSGGGLADAPVRWTVSASPGSFTPAGWNGWTFGEWVPWWHHGFSHDHGDAADQTWTFEGRTDEAGEHRLRALLESVDPPRAMNLSVEAAVTDVNQQEWSGGVALLVQPSSLCVGLRSERGFVRLGETWALQAAVTDLDGGAVAGREIALRAWRTESVQREGEWVEVERDVMEQTLVSADGPVSTQWEPSAGGRWRVRATVQDAEGRSHRSSLEFWVSGGEAPGSRRLELEDLVLVPDRESYAPGDVAQVLVVAPFAGGEGLATLERDGIVEQQRFSMDGTTHTLNVPLTAGLFPGAILLVDVVGQAARTDASGAVLADQPPRPAYAGAAVPLDVPPLARRLNVDVTPAAPVLEPGAETQAEIVVTDAHGEPVVGASVALVVVDEAVLSLTGHEISDPLDAFHPRRNSGTSPHRLRDFVRLSERMMEWPDGSAGGVDGGLRFGDSRVPSDQDEEGEDILEEALVRQALRSLGYTGGDDYEQAGRMMAAAMPVATEAPARGAAAGGGEVITTRARFAALAVFAPATTTDAEGRVSVPFTLPDNLTRYRLRAVTVDRDTRAGLGESTLTARLPLMVRPSAPRFLHDGDVFGLPVVLHNQTKQPMAVDLAAAATGLQLSAPHGLRVTVPAEDRVELLLQAQASRAGPAHVLLVAAESPAGAVAGTADSSGAAAASDAARITIPVRTPVTGEAFAVYGRLDEGAVRQPVDRPRDVRPEYGGLRLTTSSTALSSLTDAVLEISRYPYGCAEQRASRVLTVAALQDVLSAFAVEGMPSPEQSADAVRADLRFLESIQNSDGGFAFWSRTQRSDVYVSIHVTHALLAAQGRGFAIPGTLLNRALRYLSRVDGVIDAHADEWPLRTRNALKAYALRVRALDDQDVLSDVRALTRSSLDGLSMESVGWLLAAVGDNPAAENETERLLRHVGNRVTETAGKAGFVSEYADGAAVLLYGKNRTDGVMLEALLVADPDSDLVPKVVAGLLAHRTAGQWGSTQENVFVLLGLSRYFRMFESETPDFVARAWWDGRQATEQTFAGRNADRTQLDLPMSELLRGTGELVLSKEGAGRLYYRLGLHSAPLGDRLEPLDAGFTVTRVYEALDDPADVRRDDDGRWHLARGARIRVRLTLLAPAERHHVALVDALPGGLEVLNPVLAATGSLPSDSTESTNVHRSRWGGWRRAHWFQHQNLRDERAEAFTALLRPGVYEWSYVARATTPGSFMVPPPKAEEMYAPETFGRGATDRVVVE